MLGHQQGEVGVVGVELGVLVAVAVDGDDAVGVLVDHHAVGVHAEGADAVLELLGAVDDLALVQLVGQVGEHVIGQLHPNADVHPVGLCADVQRFAHALHPLAAAAAHGDDAGAALIAALVRVHGVAAAGLGHGTDRGVEIEVHPILHGVVQVLQHHVVDVRAQMADGGVQQVQVVLQAQLLDGGVAGGIEVRARAAVGHIDVVHIRHQGQSLLLADIFVERAAELVGDVVLAVGKRARAAEAVHDGAGGAFDAGFHLDAVDGTAALGQGMARLKQGDLQLRALLQQLPGTVDAARAAADDENVISHGDSSFIIIQ